MLRRFILKLSFSYLFLCLFTMNYSDLTTGVPIGEHPLAEAWSALGIQAEQVGVEGWRKISNDFYPLDKLQRVAGVYQRRLRLNERVPSLRGEEVGFSFVSIDGALPRDRTRIVLTFQSVQTANGGGETHCGLIGYAEPPADYKDFIRWFKHKVEWDKNHNPLVFTIRGAWPGRLNEEEAAVLMQQAFTKVQAVSVFAEPAGETGRWAGLSRYIKERVGKNGKEVNLEFAYRYDGIAETTYICLGTPFVPAGF